MLVQTLDQILIQNTQILDQNWLYSRYFVESVSGPMFACFESISGLIFVLFVSEEIFSSFCRENEIRKNNTKNKLGP